MVPPAPPLPPVAIAPPVPPIPSAPPVPATAPPAPPAPPAAYPFPDPDPEALRLMLSNCSKPFPMLMDLLLEYNFKLVEIDHIELRGNALHRPEADPKRVKQFVSRIKKSEHFPPVFLWKSGESLVLLDGLSRLQAFASLGTSTISAVVLQGDFADALVLALVQNKPPEGKLRRDQNAKRALHLLATAVGRPISKIEAESVGIHHSDNEPLKPNQMALLPVPPKIMVSPGKFPGPRPPSKFGKSGEPKKPTGPKGPSGPRK